MAGGMTPRTSWGGGGTQPALEAGVTYNGSSYWYNGQRYSDAGAANAAARNAAQAQQQQQQSGPTYQVNNSTAINGAGGSGGSLGGILNTSGGSNPAGSDVWVRDPTNEGGPLLTQSAYETERLDKAGDERDAAAREAQMRLGAQLQADAEARRLGYLSTVTGNQPTISRGSLAANEEQARAAAFARAKDQAGATALSGLRALEGVMAGRGLKDSSIEAGAINDIIEGGVGDIGDFTAEQLMMDLNRAAEIADSEFAGQIQQRGQNLSLVPSLMGLITSSGTVY